MYLNIHKHRLAWWCLHVNEVSGTGHRNTRPWSVFCVLRKLRSLLCGYCLVLPLAALKTD